MCVHMCFDAGKNVRRCVGLAPPVLDKGDTPKFVIRGFDEGKI